MKKLRVLFSPLIMVGMTTLVFPNPSQLSSKTVDERILEREAKANLENVTTTEAFMRVLMAAEVPGGIEVVSTRDEPIKHWLAPSNSTLREGLQSIVSVDTQYKLETLDGVVNLVLNDGKPSLLEIRLAKFQTGQVDTLDEALDYLLNLPEVRKQEVNFGSRLLRGRLGYFNSSGNTDADRPHRKLSLKYKNVTVREALNAIVRAHGRAIWAYKQGNSNGESWFEINFLNQ